MYEFSKLTENREIGWKPIKLSNGKRHAIIICPKCKSELFLGDNGARLHHIADDGTVTPSVVCTKDLGEAVPGHTPCYVCGWHEHIKLIGWKGD